MERCPWDDAHPHGQSFYEPNVLSVKQVPQRQFGGLVDSCGLGRLVSFDKCIGTTKLILSLEC